MNEIEIKNLNIRKKFVKILAYNIYLRTTKKTRLGVRNKKG